MKMILLSGGSGKRLWPLSNDLRSKQFLKVLADPNGQPESMVQRVWRQLDEAGLCGSSYIATGKSQIDMIQNQLGHKVPILAEPERRDTFPAIALAASYLYSVEGVSEDEAVAVLPVDPYVETEFFHTVGRLERVLEESGANLALIGVVPNIPSEKYGYIVPAAAHGDPASGSYRMVDSFKEKPERAEAEQLLAEDALWNCGVFAFKLGYLVDLMRKVGLPLQYEELLKSYPLLPKISFDYEVVEKERKIAVLPYSGYWKDLGTWNTLTEEMAAAQIGKGLVTGASEDTHLLNELDIPVVVMGVPGVVVAASPDGILVTSKEASPGIKNVVGAFEQRPMYEERRWGHYRVIDYLKYKDGNEVLTKRIFIEAGRNISYQFHRKRSEIWTIISGNGEIVLNELHYKVKAGDVVRIPDGTRHSILATTDLELIEVQTGSELVEEDNIRVCFSWSEIELRQNIS
ncbi:MAG: mannose-phosphate guanylyltransferase [Paenibacillaceae bacterium]|nr:mannose-phosphate guanylyltransferase [Paenibacillaceae bacterium]